MYVIDVVPLRLLPRPYDQQLSYFHSSALERGSVVAVPVGKRIEHGIVIDCGSLRERKQLVRKGVDFQLQQVKDVVVKHEIVTDRQIELMRWMSEYYWASLGITLKLVLPKRLIDAVGYSPKAGRTQLAVTLELFPDRASLEAFCEKRSDRPDDEVYHIYHGDLSAAKKFEFWNGIGAGKFQKIASTKSGLFLPFQKIEKIIIHHEASPYYKHWNAQPRYDARAVAQKLATMHKASLIFAGNLPSVQTFAYAYKKEVIFRGNSMPKRLATVRIEDIRPYDDDECFVSPQLFNYLKKAKTSLIYTNRRGFANYTVCPSCGYISECDRCSAVLKLHASPPRLLCHQCGVVHEVPRACPACKSGKVKLMGTGTQHVALLLKKQLPKATVLLMDSDNTPTFPGQRELIRQAVEPDQSGGPVILISTAMALKFVDSARFDLTTMLNLESELTVPRYDTQEQVMQTLDSLRRMSHNTVVIQAYNPKHELLKLFKGDRSGAHETFYKKELALRKQYGYPPFARFINLTIRRAGESDARDQARQLAEKLETQMRYLSERLPDEMNMVKLYGPAPAFMPKTKNKYEYQIMLALGTRKRAIKEALLRIVPSSWTIDVDPRDIL